MLKQCLFHRVTFSFLNEKNVGELVEITSPSCICIFIFLLLPVRYISLSHMQSATFINKTQNHGILELKFFHYNTLIISMTLYFSASN
jgi:hypothetical protein